MGIHGHIRRLITLPALALVLWRMLIVVAVLALVRAWRSLRVMPARLIALTPASEVLVALHHHVLRRHQAGQRIRRRHVRRSARYSLLSSNRLIARSRSDPRELALGILVIPGVAPVAGGVPQAMRWACSSASSRRCSSPVQH